MKTNKKRILFFNGCKQKRSLAKTSSVLLCLLAVKLFLMSPSSFAQEEKKKSEPTIGGVYEVAIGTRDAEPLIKYWRQFGYVVGATGELNEEQAFKLYGVRSKLKSIRLIHGASDHGLIRLFVWENPLNEGLNLTPMKVIGNRWGAMLINDVYNLQNHAEEAIRQGFPVYLVPPQYGEIYKLAKRPAPFLETLAGVREMCLIQPLTRQILFQRFGYSLPLYGAVDENSFFKSSQITHFGMVVADNRENLEFYDKVLGLLRNHDGKPGESAYENASSRAIFALNPGESYTTTDFDDPRSSATDAQKARSGRLKIVRFPPELNLPNKINFARPGSLGYSLYTYRVRGIENYRAKIRASGKAANITEIIKNEFGERSFSFVAPDGYYWTLLE
jgi:catechol 2,3-dioxygenase-like lactoylglutathione lyase family enzyme